jgi:hypothetical protein
VVSIEFIVSFVRVRLTRELLLKGAEGCTVDDDEHGSNDCRIVVAVVVANVVALDCRRNCNDVVGRHQRYVDDAVGDDECGACLSAAGHSVARGHDDIVGRHRDVVRIDARHRRLVVAAIVVLVDDDVDDDCLRHVAAS